MFKLFSFKKDIIESHIQCSLIVDRWYDEASSYDYVWKLMINGSIYIQLTLSRKYPSIRGDRTYRALALVIIWDCFVVEGMIVSNWHFGYFCKKNIIYALMSISRVTCLLDEQWWVFFLYFIAVVSISDC